MPPSGFGAARGSFGRPHSGHAPAVAPLFTLTYEYVENMIERRQPHRDAHLAHVERWSSDGPLAIAGATGDPPSGALFVFETADSTEVEDFTSADPYREAGLVTDSRIEPWKLVVHRDIADPLS